jgi:predicted outer membrane repeat protein
VTNLNDGGPGSLRQAILDANANPGPDVIRFADNLTGTIPVGSPLKITDDLTIDGPGARLLTVSNADPTTLNVIMTTGLGANLTLEGLTFMGGTVRGAGQSNLTVSHSAFVDGGSHTPLVAFGSLMVHDSLFAHNQSGAIAALGDATVSDSVFNDNQTTGGGGAIEAFRALTVADCVFTHNQASFGGAIDTEGFGPALVVRHSRFDHNSATSNGGAISSGSPGTFLDDFFTDNQVVGSFASGGALADFFGQNSLTHCLFFGNEALAPDGGSAIGGAVWELSGTQGLTVSDSQLVDNRAIGGDSTSGPGGNAQGGAIAEFDVTLSDPVIQATDTLFMDNRAVGGAGGPGAAGGSAFGGAIYGAFAAIRTPQGANTFADCVFAENKAFGGPGGDGGNGGDAFGGALMIDARQVRRFNVTTTVTLDHTLVRFNEAHGGRGANGGNAFGGGIAEGRPTAVPRTTLILDVLDGSQISRNMAVGGGAESGGTGGNASGGGIFVGAGNTSATMDGSIIIKNAAIGGGAETGGTAGQGIGGGVFSLGALSFDTATVIVGNVASTSNDDIFP